MAENKTTVQYDSAADWYMDFTVLESSRTVSETTSFADHQFMPSIMFQRRYWDRLRWSGSAIRAWSGWTGIAGISVGLLTLVYLGYTYLSGPAKGAPMPNREYCDVLEQHKCENGGRLVENAGNFVCQCVPRYYGDRCSHRYRDIAWTAILPVDNGVEADMRRGEPDLWWSFLPFTAGLRRRATISFYQNHMKRIADGFTTVPDDEMGRKNPDPITSTRMLHASRPLNCQARSMCADGLPSTDLLYERVFRRERGGFVQDSRRRNVLWHAFYQFFILQFFHTDSNPTVTGSQVYGIGRHAQRKLRSLAGGKLKTERVNGEEYPPQLSFGEKIVDAVLGRKRSHWFNRLLVAADNATYEDAFWPAVQRVYGDARKPRWATGHPVSGSDPLLFAMATLWVRQHNRVCDVLAGRRPAWTDRRVYGVAKNIVQAQMMRIMMNDVLDAGDLRYEPKTFGDRFDGVRGFGTPLELLLTVGLRTGVPDYLRHVKATDNRQVQKNGLSDTIQRMADLSMGEVTSNNDGTPTETLTKFLLELSRENAVQSFNNYRRHLGLTAYGSFYQLTGNRDTAKALKLLYGSVENVELMAGMLAERKDDVYSVPTFTVVTKSFIINSILTNPLNSETSWKPETFGGDVGFYLVESANIKNFVCNNLVDKCCESSVDVFIK